jgi:hypothetical protein
VSGVGDRLFHVGNEAGTASPVVLIHRERAEEKIRRMMPRSTE